MRKINYTQIDNIKEKYLQAVGLKDNNNQSTADLIKVQKEWNFQRNKIHILCNCSKNVEDIIVADYQNLLKIYLVANKSSLTTSQLTDLQNIFNYKKYSKLIASFFVKYHNELDITSCFYCETAYINVFPDITNNRRCFDLDHFFPKNESPLTALSLFNFIPCCQICNSRIKGKIKFEKFYSIENIKQKSKKEYYLKKLAPSSLGYDYKKNVKIKVFPRKNSSDALWHYTLNFSDNIDNYELVFINTDEKEYYNRVTNAFKLKERYNYINNKGEALYLLDLKRKYPMANLQSMSHLLKISVGELEEIIFHKKADARFHRLFGKMKEDILR